MTMPKVLEIHSHSTTSDGAYDPQRMAQLMAEHGVELWSLTDHDSVDGCEKAAEAAREEGVEFVSGIEISADLEGDSIHVLGYGIDIEMERFRQFGREMVVARRRRMEAMVERMGELGYPVEMEVVREQAGGGNMGRPHLAKALVEVGHAEKLQETFDRWLHDGGPGYVPLTRPTVEESIEMIRAAEGLVVLAHPGRYRDLTNYMEGWRDAGLWGLEVRHPSHSTEEEHRLVELADRFGFGKTASSDWHGHKPGAVERLGEVVFPTSWREEFLEALKF